MPQGGQTEPRLSVWFKVQCSHWVFLTFVYETFPHGNYCAERWSSSLITAYWTDQAAHHWISGKPIVFLTRNHFFSDLLSSGVRSKVVKGQRTYRLFAGTFYFYSCTSILTTLPWKIHLALFCCFYCLHVSTSSWWSLSFELEYISLYH